MAQSFTRQVSVAMPKGLVTEATPLTFPEDATIDELNCVVQRNGARRRRLGFQIETAGTTTPVVTDPTFAYSSFLWNDVGGQAGKSYAGVQIGNIIKFYDKSFEPLSAGLLVYEIDLEDFAIVGGEPEKYQVAAASIKGSLILVSPHIDSISVTYDPVADTYTETVIDFFIRDFEWLGPKKEYYKNEATPDEERIYDTLNCGWISIPTGITLVESGKTLSSYIVDASGNKKEVINTAGTPLSSFVTSKSAWPRLTHPWYAGKDSGGAFSVSEWEKIYSGSSTIVNGHFILSLYSMDRTASSNVAGINAVVPANLGPETSRFSAVSAYAGRVFFAGMASPRSSSRVYFSWLVQSIDDVGNFYQVNDPTAENFSDLLDTDGGYVTITEAVNIKAMHVSGSKLLVFAENGVWAISGVDDVFRATDFVIEKISEYGIDSPASLVSASGRPYWWSTVGIHTIGVNEYKTFTENNISIPTIQTFWDKITPSGKASVIGGYDILNSRVFWVYGDEGQSIYLRKNVLILDEVQGAFLPWTVSCTTTTPWLIGVIPVNSSFEDGLGDKLKFPCVTLDGQLGFSEEINKDFVDWGTQDYESYAESGYRFSGDLTLKKNAPFITVYLEPTEEGYFVQDGELVPVRPSGLFVQSRWDFSVTPTTNPQQAYLPKDTAIGGSGPFVPSKNTTMSTRLKCRGRGRVLNVRFTSEPGKDFCLLGFETIDARNTQP